MVPGVQYVSDQQRPVWELLLPFVRSQGEGDAVFLPPDDRDAAVRLGGAVQKDIASARADGIRRLRPEAQAREGPGLESWEGKRREIRSLPKGPARRALPGLHKALFTQSVFGKRVRTRET